ncbi:MAG: DUF2510 domain-containing protein [Micrococcales bacterium]|nr:DUF2510 domain-containing protein [Micrococcales bacterium]MCL2668462.1 DUF2510 domain-containing protein [Micrococcales bacterium]
MTTPGWYLDNQNPGLMRWYDGQRWTEQIRATEQVPAVGTPMLADGPSSALHWMAPVGRSWQSVVSGYFGLLALLSWMFAGLGVGGAGVGGVVGASTLALGVWALRRAAEGGHGRGRAWFAILAGAGCLVLTVMLALTSV